MPLGVSRWHADGEDDARALRDLELAKKIGEHLNKHYPNHYWRTRVDSKQGIAGVREDILLPETFWRVIKLADLFSDPHWRCVTLAGGEILERFRLERGRRKEDQWREVRAAKRHVSMARTGKVPIIDLETGRISLETPEELAT